MLLSSGVQPAPVPPHSTDMMPSQPLVFETVLGSTKNRIGRQLCEGLIERFRQRAAISTGGGSQCGKAQDNSRPCREFELVFTDLGLGRHSLPVANPLE